MLKYENFRAVDDKTFLKINRANWQKAVENKIIDMSEKSESNGIKIVWLRLGHWDPSEVSADELLQVKLSKKLYKIYLKLIFHDYI